MKAAVDSNADRTRGGAALHAPLISLNPAGLLNFLLDDRRFQVYDSTRFHTTRLIMSTMFQDGQGAVTYPPALHPNRVARALPVPPVFRFLSLLLWSRPVWARCLLMMAWIGGFALPVQAQLPPMRSTAFTGAPNSGMRFDSVVTNLPATMTAEAWVYRQDEARCETIVGQNFQSSFWLGFCSGRLRFYRSGGSFADADRNVTAKRWTHVAAVFSATSGTSGTVTFYIDGATAGTRVLSHSGGGHTTPVYLARDAGTALPFGSTYPFSGQLDEVRLWATARSSAQLRSARFQELVSEPDLRFRFAGGDTLESMTFFPASVNLGASPDTWGILPRNLVIPTTTLAPTLDGEIDSATEYAGAEQMIYRYLTSGSEIDGRMWLIAHRSGAGVQALWAGLGSPGEIGSIAPMEGASVRFLFDGNNSGGPAPAYRDFRMDYSHFAPIGVQSVSEVPLVGGFTPSPLAVNQYFTVRGAFCSSEFAPACAEFRFPWNGNALGISNTFRMMTQLSRSASTGVSGLDRRHPLDAEPSVPETWPNATIGSSAGQPVTRLRFAVQITNTRPGPYWVRNQQLRILDRRDSRVLATVENVSGDLVQELDVPRGAMIRIQLNTRSQWEYTTPAFHPADASGVLALVLGATEVDFPACNENFCSLRTVMFRVGVPPGPSSFGPIAGVTGNPDYYPLWTIRTGPTPKVLPASQITLTGTNLHDRMTVWAAPGTPGVVPTGEMAEPPAGQGFRTLPLVSVSPDGLSMVIRTEVPETIAALSIWVRDNWTRDGMGSRWRYVGNAQRVDPPYPLVHGFEFENQRDGTQFDEFSGVYQWNAYDCVTPIGPIPHLQTCIGCRLPNPLYLTFHSLVFTPWVELMTGSCLGMSATSLMFARGTLIESSFDRDARYANGFLGLPPLPESDETSLQPPKPQEHRFRPCDYSVPVNLWAQIHLNQAIQTSAEFLRNTLDQMDGTGFFFPVYQTSYTIEGNPTRTLNRIRTGGFRDHVLCFQDEGDILKAHCVVPYGYAADTGVDEVNARSLVSAPGRAVVNVYDSNDPNYPHRYFEFNLTNNTFRYWFGFKKQVTNGPSGPVTNWVDDIWTGRGAYATPLSIFTNPRTMPGLDLVGMGIGLVFFGGADGEYVNHEGGRWGWNRKGVFTNSYEGARAIAPFAAVPGDRSANSSRSLMFFPPSNRPPARLQMNVRGSEWSFHGSHEGVFCHLNVAGAKPDALDQVEFSQDDQGKMNGWSYRPQFAMNQAVFRMGVDSPGLQAVYEWDGLEFAAGGRGTFSTSKSTGRVDYRNDTGRETKHSLKVLRQLGGSTGVGTNVFGPFTIPSGARHTVAWPDPKVLVLRSSVDLNNDGTEDTVAILGPQPSPQDPPLDPPQLVILRQDKGSEVQWAVRPEQWILETAEKLSANAAWKPVETPPQLIQATLRVILPSSAPEGYYRLRRQ
jgi:hypothetical protein